MLLTRFFNNCKGGVAPMLALSIVPLIGAVGAAVDYSRANAARTAFQAALDSTALMLSKDAQNLTDTQLSQKASGYFNAMFVRPEVHNVQISEQMANPQQGSFVLTVSGTATVDTTFARVLGQPNIALSASSQVVWGIKKLNLALVLDNTGSMAQSGKMTALKTAAHNLLTTLQNAAKTPGDVQVSIVPFALDVNAGTGNAGASWIDWTDWNSKHGSCSNTNYTTQSSCLSHNMVWTAASHANWNGCVMDRDQNYDTLATAPSSGGTLFPANQAAACPAAMMPLSYDWTALNAKIDAMTPTGNTNVTIGLAWGWQTLADHAPFNAPAPALDLDKVIVLLTDGTNTQNRWSSTASVIDARTQKACDNIKAQNIKIYTVRVIDGNATLLKNCATNPKMYYDVQAASQLDNVFSSIAQNLANLRISQ